ncbi:hypothetical protein [Candidatus Frankia alpina]|uniref:hypothetical protein n=1 Tax=Candidatus Frankia alpina TaxID=2699483 RepID=UPI001A98F6D2|nr:hypothetical protein [Candidatus Frankia alpina]
MDPAPAGVLRGVSAPYHLADFTALQQLHELLPYARLIALLQDPAARAHTHPGCGVILSRAPTPGSSN